MAATVRLGRRSRGAVWSLLDQAVSSLTNLCAVIIAARLLSATGFGRFAVVYGVAAVLVGIDQALVSQALVLDRGTPKERQTSARTAVTLSAALGLMMTPPLLVVAMVVPQLHVELLVLAVSIPFLVAQDSCRYACAVLGRMELATLLDSLWLVLLCGGAVVVVGVAGEDLGPTTCVLLWSGSGAIAGLTGFCLMVWLMIPHGGRDLTGYRSRSFLGYRFLAEFALGRGANQLLVILLVPLVSVAAGGVLRGVQTLYGPLTVLVQAVSYFAAPLVSDLPSRRRTLALASIGTLLAVAGAVVCIVLVLLPDSVGRELLGPTWLDAGPMLVPLGLQASMVGVVATGLTGVRLTRPRLTLPLQAGSAVIFVASFGVGVWADGLQGAAWGFGIGTAAQASLMVLAYARATRDGETPLLVQPAVGVS